MYNIEKKKRFIGEYAHDQNTLRLCNYVFNCSEKLETSLNKDLSQFDSSELRRLNELFNNFRTGRRIQTKIVVVKEYIRFCILREGDPSVSGEIFKIYTEDVERTKHHMVSSPQHLQNFLNSVCRPESDETIDNMYRCFCWLAFGCMDEDSIYLVDSSDVNIELGYVDDGKSGIDIYPQAKEAFIKCKNNVEFRYYNDVYSDYIYRYRAEGTKLLRGIKTPVLNKRTMQTVINTKCDEFKRLYDDELRLSYRTLFLSGLFYKTYLKERDGFGIDFESAAEEFMDGKEYKFDKVSSKENSEKERHRKAKLNQVARTYEKDYALWKQAYNLYYIN